MAFKINQKVVCINADSANQLIPGITGEGLGSVVQDEIYTISLIDEYDGITCLAFREIGNYTLFDHYDFRPLDYEFVEELIKNLQPYDELHNN